MFKKLNNADKSTSLVVILGIVIVIVISFTIIKSNQTVKAWVPMNDIKAGETITDDNIHQINVPTKTPGDFIKEKDKIVGFKLRNNVEKDQLLYSSDFLASWESYNQDIDVPEDYIVTSIQVPDERACGGLIVAGDSIDIMGVSENGSIAGFDEGDNNGRRNNIGANTYYILSNVKVLNTNSGLSQAQENDYSKVSENTNTGSSDGNFYIIALSYDDAKKLRQAEKLMDLWINIAPRQNEENEPLIEQMKGQSFSGLHDAQKKVQNKDGSIKNGVKKSESNKEDNTTVTNETPNKITNNTTNN